MTFHDYVGLVARSCGVRPWITAAPPWLSLLALRLLQPVLHDVVLTREELDGLVEEKLVSRQLAQGTESVTAWLLEHGRELGLRYVNDGRRHFGGGATEPILVP